MTSRGARNRGMLLLALAASAALLLALAAPLAPAAGPAYRGVNMHPLSTDDDPTVSRELGAARRLGANTVRVDVAWPSFEPQARGRIDPVFRARVDRFMEAAAARRIKVLAIIWGTPCWATTPSGTPPQCAVASPATIRPPWDARDYGRFVRYFTARYRRRLAAIEVWNEPNLGSFFQADDRPREYTKLVKAAFPQVKAVAPEVKVLAGALSGADADFLEGMYYYGARGSYDAISIHPYTADGGAPPDAPAPDGQEKLSFLDGLRLIRRTQRAHADTTPAWVTEFGWNTGAYRNATFTPWLNGVSQQRQGDYLAQALALLNGRTTGLGFVQGAMIYTVRDTDPSEFALGSYGILRYDLSRKPSFLAVRRSFAAISRTRQLDRMRALGRRR